jgi:hypothetical protein
MLTKIDHHAYVVAGQKESLIPLLLDLFQNQFEIAVNGNPDFSQINFESLGIDEARKVKDLQSMKSFGDSKRIFLGLVLGSKKIVAGFHGVESQDWNLYKKRIPISHGAIP